MNDSNSTVGAQPILEADNLTKRYEDGLLALDSISFSVSANQVFAMLGGNGAGKTTTINLFLNLIEPTSGEARINGIATHKEPLEAKKHVAFVSENVMLYGNFTAIQNLDFFARLGSRDHYSRDDYHAVLNRVGLDEAFHNRPLRGFSKGMRQKCGIAIAILKDSPAILLDEPTSGLDPKAAHEFIHLLASLRGEGKAILMSTHDIFRAREAADMIGIMNDGKFVMQKTAAELEGYDLESLYMEYMAGQLSPAGQAEG